jgi:hypothetical protein
MTVVQQWMDLRAFQRLPSARSASQDFCKRLLRRDADPQSSRNEVTIRPNPWLRADRHNAVSNQASNHLLKGLPRSICTPLSTLPIAPSHSLVQKIHEAANSSGLNAEQRRNRLPLLGAVVTRQRTDAP